MKVFLEIHEQAVERVRQILARVACRIYVVPVEESRSVKDGHVFIKITTRSAAAMFSAGVALGLVANKSKPVNNDDSRVDRQAQGNASGHAGGHERIQAYLDGQAEQAKRFAEFMSEGCRRRYPMVIKVEIDGQECLSPVGDPDGRFYEYLANWACAQQIVRALAAEEYRQTGSTNLTGGGEWYREMPF